jgi:cytoskeleton-associated protein 5
VNSVIDVLLVDGLASKKPKVVQAAVTLILDAALEFGAATLPLASITKASSKLMSHSNAKVRETGMKVLAEICRALGSKTPIQSTIDEMKPTQIKELDSLLENQPEASKPRTMFRTYQSGLSAEPPRDALAALQSGTAELEAQRYAARPTINLMSEVAKTEYVAKLGLSKWSEKVAALKIVLECAGEKPYKLAEQSSSCNYVSLINDMKKLLSHTHFAVVSNAIKVLGMLAEGVGEKLYSHLRLMLVPLLQLAKDKKLAKAVSSCLDSMFGNVLSFEHLLEREDALPDAVDEQKQKNALVRTAALDLLSRSVKRSGQAGPRSVLSTGVAKRITSFCAEKLEDSNADVRKAASDTLKALQGSEDPDIVELADAAIESLRSKNPRAHKALSRTSDQAPGAARGRSTIPPEAKITSKPASATTAASKASMARASSNRNGDKSTKTSGPSIDIPSPSSKTEKADLSMSLSSAIAHAGKLPIPLWGAAEEDGGILRGLESAKGIMRQDAIKSLTSFVESGKLIASKDIDKDCTALLTIVREHTRGFNETNVNIMKGIVQLFIAMCDVHEKMECLMNDWSAKAGTSVAVAKISDKKASDGCKSLLSALCVVCAPHTILLAALEAVQTVKTPVAHEELLKWIAVFCGEFGAAVLGPHLGDLIPFILLEVVSSNPKVKRESLVALGVIHAQLGGQFRALVLSLAKGPVRDLVEGCLDSYPFDSSQVTSEWPKISLAIVNSPHNSNSQSGLVLDIPKTDLIEELSEDTLLKLNSKDGKTAWKYRKEALEEIEAALKRCSGLIKTEGSNLRPITDLARLLEQRLSDTQINLKPIAASVIARLLSAVDASTQARVGKIVFSQLISAAMNDIKKPMRDNCLLALRAGVAIPSLDGGGINGEALEVLVASLIGQVNEVATRAGGLADVLVLMTSFTESLSNLDEVTSSRGQSLGERYAVTIVECLTSSKTETRAAATSLAELSIECGVVGMGSFRKATEKLKPAQQRTVGPLIAQFTKRVDPVSESGKENDESLVVPLVSRHRKGSSVGEALVSHEEKEKSKTAPVDKVKASKRHEREHESSSNQHPLLNRSGQASRHIVHKVLVWPEYPEEPQGASLLTSLKRAWSELLPGGSLSALFPASGINKQDDALDGCEILKQVIQLDRSNNKDVLIWQVDYALKWITVVLCSRETTVGLVAVLEVVEDLLKFLIERNHKLTDSDGAVCIPFLIEKAGTAKGRFRDKFAEIEMLIQDEQLLSTKQLGGFCVAVMEGSAQAKARASACRLCIECLERDGLVAMGKKGVLVAAKAVSDETIPENRSLALTLMMKILFRMNGEFTKLERICGPSLTNHGRQLLEERWARREKDSTEPTDSSSSGRKAKVTVNGELKQTGTAGEGTATLRARLLALREKPKDLEPPQADESLEDTYSTQSTDVEILFTEGIAGLKSLSTTNLPLPDESPALQSAIDGLKKFHAALSKQQNPVPGLSVIDLSRLRQIICENLGETMEQLTHLIGFSFDCGDPSINAGLSIPLLSVCLATLMAMFRDADICAIVAQDQLGLLIREAGTALLDPRLSSTSDINEATGSQMVRAINKLAVQAATGAQRHTSLLALMALQQQISLIVNNGTSLEEETFNGRLSRVLTKLFMRVVKAEESNADPFSNNDFDLEAVLCGTEDFLSACKAASECRPMEMVTACRDMITKLAEALLKNRGSSALCGILEDLELLETAEMVAAMTSVADVPIQDEPIQSAPSSSSDDACTGTFSSINNPNSISSLVSALANVKTETERAVALEALREYEQQYGDGDLQAHLQQVSPAFREFIERQMSGTTENAMDGDQQESGSMSERLRQLRTRLAVTEAAVNTAVTMEEITPAVPPSLVGAPATSPPESPETQDAVPTDLGAPTTFAASSRIPTKPSRLAQPSPSKLPISVASQQLRQRLAASAQIRDGMSPLKNPSSPMSRAAALRARLEAVKSTHQSGEDGEVE